MTEALYESSAHDASFGVLSARIVRFSFRDPRASGYARSRDGFV